MSDFRQSQSVAAPYLLLSTLSGTERVLLTAVSKIGFHLAPSSATPKIASPLDCALTPPFLEFFCFNRL